MSRDVTYTWNQKKQTAHGEHAAGRHRRAGHARGPNGANSQVREKHVLGCGGQRGDDGGSQTPPQTQPRRQLQRERPPVPTQEPRTCSRLPRTKQERVPLCPFLSVPVGRSR